MQTVIVTHLLAVAVAAALISILAAVKSLLHFTRAGPAITEQIVHYYIPYTLYAFSRLVAWAFIVAFAMGWVGHTLYLSFLAISRMGYSFPYAVSCSILAVLFFSALQFCRHLLYIPSSIAASSLYRLSRFYPLWRRLSPLRLRRFQWGTVGIMSAVLLGGILAASRAEEWDTALEISLSTLFLGGLFLWATWSPEKKSPNRASSHPERPNILMIGTDTLRADRFVNPAYPRRLTPFIDRLAQQGTLFRNCYVPLGRTAPSLVSLLTGLWPFHHGIRDNYLADEEILLPEPTLPRLLAASGYTTAALSDWAGSDLKKIDFGFQYLDVPPDQWNFKYYIRQGPMDLRLFLSLFTHNRFGKRFLPEIHYLAGIPLTAEIGREARNLITTLGARESPFFINVFFGTTHLPFGSEYPFYTLYTPEEYQGESKFVMTLLNEPEEIIRKQEARKEAFDLKQIQNLYDGCIRSFDAEVEKIVSHLESRGLRDDTVIVIYSDHGVDFFENETWGQGNSLFGDDPSGRIPLLILDPRRRQKREVQGVARSIDLAPTLLDLAGVNPPSSMDGVSLGSFMEEDGPEPDLPAYQETGIWLGRIPGMDPDHLTYPGLLDLLEIRDKKSGTLAIKSKYQPIILQAKDRMIRQGRWKLVYTPVGEGARFHLFDILKDPECRHDVAGRFPEVLEALKQSLRKLVPEGERYF